MEDLFTQGAMTMVGCFLEATTQLSITQFWNPAPTRRILLEKEENKLLC